MVDPGHGSSARLTHWTFAFYLVAIANFRVRMISVGLANARATRMKTNIEPSFTQWLGYVYLSENAYLLVQSLGQILVRYHLWVLAMIRQDENTHSSPSFITLFRSHAE